MHISLQLYKFVSPFSNILLSKTHTAQPEGHFTPARKTSVDKEAVEADEEFVMTEGGTEDDDEQTLEEEEKMEEDLDHKDEIDNLQKEGSTKSKFTLIFDSSVG